MTTLNKRILTSLAVALVLVVGGASSFADTSTGAAPSPTPGKHHRHHGMRKVIQACAKANDITLPAKGSGDTLSTGDRTALHACVQEFRTNIRSCVEKAGITRPAPGTPPSAADKAAFMQCRTEALSQI